MTAFPDPEVRLREVILRCRGRTPSGEYTRVVDFPRILMEGVHTRLLLERRGFKDLPPVTPGAYLGIECQWHSSIEGIPRHGDIILDPMLAYLVDLLKYGYEEMKTYHSVREGKEWNPPEPVFPEGFEAPMPNKPVKDGMNCYGGRMNMPTFSHGPRGYRAASGEGGNNAVLNCFLATIAFGASTMQNYDNCIPDFRPDDTEERLAIVREELDFMNVIVVEDSGWKGRSGGRCITDYTRSVLFNVAPTMEELALFREMLSLDKSPGWTGIGCRKLGVAQFTFTTTMDSSD